MRDPSTIRKRADIDRAAVTLYEKQKKKKLAAAPLIATYYHIVSCSVSYPCRGQIKAMGQSVAQRILQLTVMSDTHFLFNLRNLKRD